MDNITLIESFADFKDEKLIDRVTLIAILEELILSSFFKIFSNNSSNVWLYKFVFKKNKSKKTLWLKLETIFNIALISKN